MKFINEYILENTWVIKIGTILLITAGGIILMKIMTSLAKRTLHKSNLDPVIYTFIINLLRIIMWVVLVFTLFAYVGLSISTLLTLTAAIGAAAALALQESLSNFAGGILILLTKPFKKGDLIDDLQISGRVQEIDLLYTTLITLDNKIVTVPNGKLANGKIINYSGANTRRVDCQFGISYDSDITKAKEVLRDIAAGSPMILKEPECNIGVSGHDASAVILDFFVWCNTKDYYPTKYYIEEEVKNRFDEAGIVIPFDQITVHMAGDDRLKESKGER